MINHFKNPQIFKIDIIQLANVQTALERESAEGLYFKPCTEFQVNSLGFAPDPVTSLSGGNFMLNLKLGERKIIAAELKSKLDSACKKFLVDNDRDPIKGEKAQIKDDILRILIPKAFEQVSNVKAFYHHKTGHLICSHQTSSGGVLHLLTKLLSAIKTTTLHVDGIQHSLTKCLGDAIEVDEDYAIGRFAYQDKLHFINEDKDEVTFKGDYNPEQVSELIESGYNLKKVQLSSQGVSFDMTDRLKFQNINFDFDERTQDSFDDIDDRADYEKALFLYQLDLVADMAVDLVKTLEEKAKEYQNA